jgi:hypothetical protein
MAGRLSVFNGTFWDLWVQKIFRNIASVKYQWLLYMAIPTFWAMFNGKWYCPPDAAPSFIPMLNHTIGYTFLGGGFITLAVSRIVARTKLTEDDVQVLDTDE